MAKWDKKPLYRKVNTRARGVHHRFGGDYKHSRGIETAVGMSRGMQRGLDYTPLFRFLLSKVGGDWDEIHSEAVSRLDKQEPISWMVAKHLESTDEFILVGESTYFSGLYIDKTGILRVVNPELDENSLVPSCKCCTHTLNGIPFTRLHGE